MQRLNEASLEALIVDQMVEGGWVEGSAAAYDSSYALDLGHLAEFIEATQPQLAATLGLGEASRHKVLARLQGEITKRGVVHLLRNGLDHLGQHIDLYYPTATDGNAKAAELFEIGRASCRERV